MADHEKALASGKRPKRVKKHHFRSTHVIHHDDGTHTLHLEHEKGPDHDVHSAVPDLDAVHDKLEEQLGEPNEGEDQMVPPGGMAPGALA